MMRSRLGAALVVLVAALAGCDYEGNSKDDFVSDANAVCEASGSTVMPALSELEDEGLPTESDLRGFAGDVVLPALQKRLFELRRLDPPTEDRDTFDDMIAKMQKGIDDVRADPQQILDGDPFLPANAEARAYGLTSCVLSPAP